jgi:hypothetical protein
MRYLGFLACLGLVMCSSTAFAAEMSPEQVCEKQGDVAKKAASMRISGTDKDTATKTLIRMYDRPDSGVTADNVRGMVYLAYGPGARMDPDYLRKFAIKQCNIK